MPTLFTFKVNNIVGDTIMATTIKNNDLQIIIDIANRVIWYKQQALSSKSYAAFEALWLPKLVQQINDNAFTWNDRNRNTANWLIDQIAHCNTITQGVKPKDGVPLADTDLGERALRILRAMSRGQESYDSFAKTTNFNDLFQQ